MSAATPPAEHDPGVRRASRGCRTSSRPTTRRPTSRPWSPRRSRPCRRSPTRSRSSPSTTARRIGRSPIAERLAAAHPDVVRVVHHPVNRGYGGALRSGFEASRYELLRFTDGDRQFRIADLGRLTARLAEPDAARRRRRLPDQARRPVHPDRLRAHVQARQPDLLRPHGPGRRLRVQAVPARGARGRPGRVRRRVLLGRAAHQESSEAARSSRSACPHYPRTAGSPTGAKPIGHLARGEGLLVLRLRLWANRDARAGAVGRSSAASDRPA